MIHARVHASNSCCVSLSVARLSANCSTAHSTVVTVYSIVHSVYTMDFIVSTPHKLEDEIQSCSDLVVEKLKCKKLENMSRDLLKSRSVTKDILVDRILSIGPLICKSKSVLRSASATIDEQKSELLANQKSLIKAKEDLITSQKLKFDTVQETVKKEIQTFSDVDIENCSGNGSNAVTPAKLKRAMRTAIIDEEQPHNFLIFGADE